MRRAQAFVPLVLVFSVVGCTVLPDEGGDDAETGGFGGAGGLGARGGSAGSSMSGTGGSSGGATGGAGPGSGGSLIAGASFGGGVGASAGTGGTIGGAAGTGSGGTVGGAGAAAGGVGGVNGGSAGLGEGAGRGGAGGGGKGGGAGLGGGGGGGASGFSPCPAAGACKILPLGDSITDGIGVTGGGSYRIELFRLAIAGGKEITYVGGSMNGPTMVDGVTFPRAHEGHSGWTISQIDGIVPSPALGPDPHIILLHIGTNDLVQTAAGAPDRLATLMDQILADLPNSLLVVAKIIPLSNSAAVTTFNNAIPALVQSRASMGKHVLMVDQFTGFPTSELADGVHPNAAGYARMARVWYAAISSSLP